MKTKVFIGFEARDIPGKAAAILTPSGCGPNVAEISDSTILKIRTVRVRIRLDETDDRAAKVIALLQQHGVEFETFLYDEYSEEDLQNARLLRMTPAANAFVSAGLYWGTKYDESEACPNCHTGARQTSALYVGADDLRMIRKHRAIGSWEAHIIVDGGMVKKLKDAGITGISFGDVRARLRNEKWTSVARDQILIAHTLPPMRGEPTAEDKDLCTVCRRGGRTTVPKERYREEDLVGMQDFNLTWEWFGCFWPPDEERHRLAKWPSPSILVTPKAMNVFRNAGVKTFDWRPVNIAA